MFKRFFGKNNENVTDPVAQAMPEKAPTPQERILEAAKILNSLKKIPNPSSAVTGFIFDLNGSINSLQQSLDDAYSTQTSAGKSGLLKESTDRRLAALVELITEIESNGYTKVPTADQIASTQIQTPKSSQSVSPRAKIEPDATLQIITGLEDVIRGDFRGLSAQEAGTIKEYLSLLDSVKTGLRLLETGIAGPERTTVNIALMEAEKKLKSTDLAQRVQGIVNRFSERALIEKQGRTDTWAENELQRIRRG